MYDTSADLHTWLIDFDHMIITKQLLQLITLIKSFNVNFVNNYM